jgi:predicted nucleic acid-binding protein
MRWLLDTCTLSESTYLRPHPGVQDWLTRHGDDCAVSAASFGEIQYGVACLPPSSKRNQLQAWALALAQRFEGRVLATDEAVWRQFGDLKASLRAIGRMQDALDMVIAATALHHGLTLVTRNTRYFEDTGIRLVNPWADEPSA